MGLFIGLNVQLTPNQFLGIQWLVLLMMLGASEKTMVGFCTSTPWHTSLGTFRGAGEPEGDFAPVSLLKSQTRQHNQLLLLLSFRFFVDIVCPAGESINVFLD